MKILCEKCSKDLSKSIAETFETYQVGKVKCKTCSKRNTRYISESDLLIYFASSCILYTLAVIAIYFLFNMMSTVSPFVIYGVIFVLFIGMYFLTKNICYYIYEKAPFKSAWKDFEFKEDVEGIKKRLKWQFIMFLLVALMFGSQPNLINYAFLLLITFTILIVIKVYLSIRNERNTFESRKKISQ
ncbi:hypothetical protein [Anaerorhabdus sp.]|uniref:hypothetical protein n=1 Tax=Anaerorhabdus sp. TaxID=1872524 RepID=UPI002FCBBBCC